MGRSTLRGAVGTVALACALGSGGPAGAAETFNGHTYYLGDLHAHTGASGDGGSSDLGTCAGSCGAVADVIQLAQDNGLDFVAITDHSNGDFAASNADYATVLAEVIAGNDPTGGFITLPGSELALHDTDGNELGHRNVLFFDNDDSLLSTLHRTDLVPSSRSDDTEVTCEGFWDWVSDLNTAWGDVLTIPHHPIATIPMPMDWSCHDPTWEPVVETYSIHGNSIDSAATYDPIWSSPTASGSVHSALNPATNALKLGFVGGSDRHDTDPGETCSRNGPQGGSIPYGGGLTIAMLDEGEAYTRANLHDALVDRQTLSTSGPMLPVEVRWGSGTTHLGGMGEELSPIPGQPLRVVVRIPTAYDAAVKQVVLVTSAGVELPLSSPGTGIWIKKFPSGVTPWWAYVRVDIDGPSWYGGSCSDGGTDDEERVWTSPSWFR